MSPWQVIFSTSIFNIVIIISPRKQWDNSNRSTCRGSRVRHWVTSPSFLYSRIFLEIHCSFLSIWMLIWPSTLSPKSSALHAWCQIVEEKRSSGLGRRQLCYWPRNRHQCPVSFFLADYDVLRLKYFKYDVIKHCKTAQFPCIFMERCTREND